MLNTRTTERHAGESHVQPGRLRRTQKARIPPSTPYNTHAGANHRGRRPVSVRANQSTQVTTTYASHGKGVGGDRGHDVAVAQGVNHSQGATSGAVQHGDCQERTGRVVTGEVGVDTGHVAGADQSSHTDPQR